MQKELEKSLAKKLPIIVRKLKQMKIGSRDSGSMRGRTEYIMRDFHWPLLTFHVKSVEK